MAEDQPKRRVEENHHRQAAYAIALADRRLMALAGLW
jgi:hypothetical protein